MTVFCGGFMQAFKWILKYLKIYRIRLIIAFLLASSVALINMVPPYVQGHIVDEVILGKMTNKLFMFLSIIAAVTILKAIIRYIYQYLFETVSQNTIYNIREAMYVHIQELDFGFFDKTKTGDIMTRMTGDLEAVRHFTSWVIFGAFFNILTFVTVIIVLFTINVRFTLILLLVTPVVSFFAYKLAHNVKGSFRNIREQFSKLNSVVQENISGNRVVKAFAREDYEIYKFSRENEGFRDENIKASKVWAKYLPILDSMAGTLGMIILLVGGIMVVNKTLTLGELVTFNGFIWALNNPMRMAGWIINDFQRFSASGDKIKALLEVEPAIKDSENYITRDKLRGSVEFKNVRFCYKDEDVLNEISFTVNPGQTIAVIGPTGSGKSTLMNLICRFYDCDSGEVLIDNINVKEIELKKLRENVAIAMQDIFLFSDTIEGNIAYGVPEASQQQVEWAARVAGASDFIDSFPDGYETIIGERGVGLSGGQKQRIALARALIKNPSILILDDTTSSVDIETEHEIQQTLNTVYESKTTFIIAHRISSVKNADQILVLDNGKIIEKGTHEELIALKGYYYSVFINQYGDFDNFYAAEVG